MIVNDFLYEIKRVLDGELGMFAAFKFLHKLWDDCLGWVN